MGTFTLWGEPPSSDVCLRELLAAALLPWEEGREEVGRMTEISSMWEKMQLERKLAASPSARGKEMYQFVYICVCKSRRGCTQGLGLLFIC